jgi:Na+-transporting NADH:ubiquinone oxidoreductase subunit D
MIMPPGGFFVLAIIIWIIREKIMKEAKND